MEDKRERAIASDDPVKRQGNDEREDRFPYGGDREGAEEAKEVAGPKPVTPADSSKSADAMPSTRRKPVK